MGPCGPRRKGRGTLGLPPQGVEKQGYPPDLLVEDGPREPPAPMPGVIRTSHTTGYGFYGVHVHCTALTQRPPGIPSVLAHVLAVDSDHAAVICTCRTCSCDTAPQSICRGRRTASACAASPHMPPRCADMPAAVTAEPHAPTKVVGHRSAHDRTPKPGRHGHVELGVDRMTMS